ncbi:organic cation transporter protein-like [Lytechinus variegatus]|uniref:organic cation transporter protein-like n=1 Tax=Lytechinus variegatus TaxID=7654 RepID=UPI001BB15E56|nr:organic cation transporter protein-like [Lytechinus variegatus]
MKFDDILRILGEFGTYQRRNYALICLIVIPQTWNTLIQLFAMGDSDHWCQVPGWNNTFCEEYGVPCDVDTKKMLNIPLTDGKSSNQEFQKCARYNTSDFSVLSVVTDINGSVNSDHHQLAHKDLRTDLDVIPCDAGWEYDRSQYTRTFVQETDLVCADAKYIQFSQMFYYGGYLAGSAIFGALGDRFGRKPVLVIGMIFRIIFGYSLALVHNYWAFAVIRFFNGTFQIGPYILAYVLGTEFVGISKRNISGLFFSIPYAMGYMMLAGIAYLIRDWRLLQIALITPLFLFFIVFLFLPESPRWLLSQGETEKARKIIQHAAKVNKVQLPDDFLDDQDDANQNLEYDEKETERKPNFTDVFRHRSMCKRTIILMYAWAVCAMVYHGLSLSTSNLGIDVYLSFFVSAAIELPAYILSIFIVEHPWFGRKRSTVIMMLCGGVACVLTIFITPGPVRAGVAFIGKFGISGAFNLIYLFTLELYPTILRTVGLGICSMAGRIANMLAPLVLLTGDLWIHSPLLIFGTCTVLSGLLCLFLPETRGKKLPETVEDGENFGKISDTNGTISYPVNGFYELDEDDVNDSCSVQSV